MWTQPFSAKSAAVARIFGSWFVKCAWMADARGKPARFKEQRPSIANASGACSGAAMVNELDVVRDVCGKLEQAAIDYMLTGSMAMNYYAQPRMTRDIDMIVAMGAPDVNRIINLFQSDYYVSREALVSAIGQRSMFNIIPNE